MAGERYGRIIWPGLLSCQSARYTMSHGISPGSCIVTCNPQKELPAFCGDLIFTDGYTKITLPNCQLDTCSSDMGGGGTSWRLVFRDRRWMWSLGAAIGTYNQVDSRGIYDYSLVNQALNLGAQARATTPTKYIPWTLRTTGQLVEFLLEFMGEDNYEINLPEDALHPIPPQDWDYSNPAHALSQICQTLGCRIVYQLDPTGGREDGILIGPQGEGAELPAGSISHEAPSYSNLRYPDSILLVGAPVRWQMRVLLEAVGEDWDLSVRPINELSYAPVPKHVQCEVHIIPDSVPQANDDFSVIINGIVTTYAVGATPTLDSECVGLAAAINKTIRANTALAGMSATALPAVALGHVIVQVLGDAKTGAPFLVATVGLLTELTWVLVDPGGQFQNAWAYCGPPTFSSVQATPRLTKQQAVEKAKKSVFKWFRVVNRELSPIDPANPGPLAVPGLSSFPGISGQLVRIQQWVLQDNRLEQVLPTDQDPLLHDTKVFGIPPLTKQYYDGTQRTKPATSYGSIALACIQAQGLTCPLHAGLSTPIDSEIAVPFSIDKERLLVMYQNYVYVRDKGRWLEPDLMLETAVQIRAPDTNGILRYQNLFTFPGDQLGTPPAVIKKPDVQLNYLVHYQDAIGNARNVDVVESDIQIAVAASDYYLRNEASKYEIVQGRDRSYNGLILILLDGAISQVTWEIGPSGCTTTASRNSEHNYWVPSYPERLHVERLDALERPPAKPTNKGMAEGRDQ